MGLGSFSENGSEAVFAISQAGEALISMQVEPLFQPSLKQQFRKLRSNWKHAVRNLIRVHLAALG